MSKTFSDTDEYSEHELNPEFQVVPSYSDNEEDQSADEPVSVEWHPVVLMLAKCLKSIFTPIFRIVFAPKTQEAIVKSLVVTIVVAWILLTSFTAYITFYQRYIPKTAHIEPIYFQYRADQFPEGQVEFKGPHPDMPLRSEQAYDVSLQLYVPTSDVNFDLGNFMVHVELLSKNGTVLAESSRPAILRYQSYAQRILHVIAKAFPLLLGWTEESQLIHVVLLESFIERKASPLTQARITLSTPKLQLYSAQLNVIADFRGLRYYMYHQRMTTAFIFIVLFTSIEVIFAIAAWNMFGKNVWLRLQEAFSIEEVATITEEEEEEGSYVTEDE